MNNARTGETQKWPACVGLELVIYKSQLARAFIKHNIDSFFMLGNFGGMPFCSALQTFRFRLHLVDKIHSIPLVRLASDTTNRLCRNRNHCVCVRGGYIRRHSPSQDQLWEILSVQGWWLEQLSTLDQKYLGQSLESQSGMLWRLGYLIPKELKTVSRMVNEWAHLSWHGSQSPSSISSWSSLSTRSLIWIAAFWSNHRNYIVVWWHWVCSHH